MKPKIGGSWRSLQSVNVKVAGSWKQATDGFTKVNGSWKRFGVQPLALSYPTTNLDTNLTNQVVTATVTGGNAASTKSFSITSGTLPTGCTFNSATGSIVGPTMFDYPAHEIPFDTNNLSRSNASGDLFVVGSVTTSPTDYDDFGARFGNLAWSTSNTFTYGKMYVAKMNASGKWLWATTATQQTNTAFLSDMETTGDGGVVISGYFNGNLTLGSTTLSSGSYWASYIAKIGPNGDWLWAHRIYSTVNNIFTAASLSVDPSNGDIYAGLTLATTSYIINGTTYTSGGNHDGVVLKFTSSGAFAWVARIATSTRESVNMVRAVSGGAYVVGDFTTSTTIGSTPLTSTGTADYYVAFLSSSGSFSWASRWGANTTEYAWSATVLSDGGLVIGGTFSGTATFGGITRTSTSATVDAFWAKISSSGTWQWVTTGASASGNDQGYLPYYSGSTTTPIVIYGGYSSTAATLGGTAVTTRSLSWKAIGKLNSDGTPAWAASFGGTCSEVNFSSTSMAVLGDGSMIIAGFYQGGTLTAGGTTLPTPTGFGGFTVVLSASGSFSNLTQTYSATPDAYNPVVVPRSSNSAHVHFVLPRSTTSGAGNVAIADVVFAPSSESQALINGRVVFMAETSGAFGGTAHRGLPATLTITASDGIDTASGQVSLRQGTNRVLGGVQFSDATYYYNVFRASGSFILRDSNLDVTILAIGGGGGSSRSDGSAGPAYSNGGGGAGGVLASSQTLAPGTYPVVVGAGGAMDSNGSNTQFGALVTAIGGGKGGLNWLGTGGSGGSGGGGGYNRAAGSGTAGQGNAGGAGNGNGGGGGGGAGGAGATATSSTTGASGGAGTSAYSAWAAATRTGMINQYAGGGAGAVAFGGGQSNSSGMYVGVAGSGGGAGRTSFDSDLGTPAARSTGGGGSSAFTTQGASGLVIVRYLRSAVGG